MTRPRNRETSTHSKLRFCSNWRICVGSASNCRQRLQFNAAAAAPNLLVKVAQNRLGGLIEVDSRKG